MPLESQIIDQALSNSSYGGGGRIRTCVALRAADLQSAPINHSGTPPGTTFVTRYQPERGFEPTNLPIRARPPSGLSLLMTEPERGLEPTDLPFTKRLLYQLSYSGISNSITKREIAVNQLTVATKEVYKEVYTEDGGYKSETSYGGWKASMVE